MPTNRPPDVIVLGDSNITRKLAEVLTVSGRFASIHQVHSLSGLWQLTNSGALAEDIWHVYLVSPTVATDLPGVGLDAVIAQVRNSGQHSMLAIGGTAEGDALGAEYGLVTIRPGMNIPETIAKVHGMSAPKRTGGLELVGSGEPWKKAAQDAAEAPNRRLGASREGVGAWTGAVREARRPGTDAVKRGVRVRGYIVTVATPRGGVGKTSLSTNLAVWLAGRLKKEGEGRRVCLVDMNLQQADVGTLIGRDRPNVMELVDEPNRLTPERIESSLVHDPGTNLFALVGAPGIEDAHPDGVNADLYEQILELLRGKFDYIIIDAPVAERWHAVMNMLLPISNYIVVPLIPDKLTLRNVRKWMASITAPVNLNGLGINDSQVGFVLNKAKLGVGVDPDDVREYFPSNTFLGMIPDSSDWQKAMNENKLVGAHPTRDLNEAFRAILYGATSDPSLAPDRKGAAGGSSKREGVGWMDRLLGRR